MEEIESRFHGSDGEQAGQGHRHDAGDRRDHFGSAEPISVVAWRAKALQEVGDDHRGRRVQARRNRGLGGGKDARHHEARHTGRQLARDEKGQDCVGLRQAGEVRGKLPVVDKHRRAHTKQQAGVDQCDPGIGPQRATGRRDIGGRLVALDHALIRNIGHQLAEQTADQHDPDRSRRVVTRPTDRAELVVLRGDLDQRAETTVEPPHDERETQQRRTDEKHRLGEIRPHHAFDAADHRIERADGADEHDARDDVQIGDRGEREGRQINDERHAAELEQHKGRGPVEPRAEPKARFQKLVGRGRAQPRENRQQHENHDRREQHDRHVDPENRPVLRVGFRGNRHVGDRTDVRDTDAHHPPRNPPAGRKVIGRTAVAPRKPKTERQGADQVGAERKVV